MLINGPIQGIGMETQILVRVRVGEGIEMELRGDPETFVTALEALPTMVSKVRSSLTPAASITPYPVPPQPYAEVTEFEKLPSIEKPNGVQDAILKVLSTPWAKQRPRTWKDIRAALRANAIHLSNGSITGALTLLVQARKARRSKLGSSYAYTMSLTKNGSDIEHSKSTS